MGTGASGRSSWTSSSASGCRRLIVERDPARIQSLLERGLVALEGDASSEDVLTRAGVSRARGLIAAVSTDAENVYTILSARLMQPTLYIIGRASSDESAHKLTRAGADRVISPYQIGGLHMAQLALRPTVVEFVQLATSSEFLELSMEQIEVRPDGPLAGATIVGANLRQGFGVIVIGMRRATGRMEFNPPPDARMEAGDHLVVLGPNDRLITPGRSRRRQGSHRVSRRLPGLPKQKAKGTRHKA